MDKMMILAPLLFVCLGIASADDSADATATPTCPTNADGAGYYAPTGLCYSVFKTKVTYSAAASACVGAYGAGNTGQLALLTTSAINDFVLDVVMSVPGAAHNWFGLSRPTTTSPFVWGDGSALGSGFSDFNPGETVNRPRKEDLCNYKQRGSGRWFTRECDDTNHYICQGPPIPVETSQESASASDPAPVSLTASDPEPAVAASTASDDPATAVASTSTGGGVSATSGGGGVSPTSGEGSAQQDPHLLVFIDGESNPVCFDLFAQEDEIYQLIHDPATGVTVNAQITQPDRSKKASFFKALAFVTEDCIIEASKEGVYVNHEKMEWEMQPYEQECGQSVFYNMLADKRLAIRTTGGLGLTMTAVRAERIKVDYMNFLLNQRGDLSKDTHGILGQFEGASVKVEPISSDGKTALLSFTDGSLRAGAKVTSKGKYDAIHKERVQCWFSDAEGEGIIEGAKSDYLVADLEESSLASGLEQFASMETLDASF